MAEILGINMLISSRPARSAYTLLTDPTGGDFLAARLTAGDLVLSASFENPAGTIDNVDPAVAFLNEGFWISGVPLTASSVAVYWRRPGVADGANLLAYGDNQGSGVWHVNGGQFDLTVAEGNSDHGAVPWTDLDFAVKVVSPDGAAWSNWVDASIAANTTASKYADGFDPALTAAGVAQSGITYGIQSDGATKVEDQSIELTTIGDTWDVRFDYEGEWEPVATELWRASDSATDFLAISVADSLADGVIQVDGDWGTIVFDESQAHGRVDDERVQIRVLFTWDDPVAIAFYWRQPTLALSSDTGWNLLGSTTVANGTSDSPTVTKMAWGWDEVAAGEPEITGKLRAFYFKAVTVAGGTVTSGWEASGKTDIDGTDGDAFTDDNSFLWKLLVSGTGNTVSFQG